jgi:CheY-like chemotaxis protein
MIISIHLIDKITSSQDDKREPTLHNPKPVALHERYQLIQPVVRQGELMEIRREAVGMPGEPPATVLVVEDAVLVRAATSGYLRKCGFEVVEAVSAEEALELLGARADIKAVFADVKLPGRSGADLAHLVSDDYPRVKVLLTSGVAPFPDVGGVGLLKKPYFPFEVEQRLKSMLGLAASKPR